MSKKDEDVWDWSDEFNITLTDLVAWIREQIDGIDKDIKMDKECKELGLAIPFGERNEDWMKSIKGRKIAYEDTLARIEMKRINIILTNHMKKRCGHCGMGKKTGSGWYCNLLKCDSISVPTDRCKPEPKRREE